MQWNLATRVLTGISALRQFVQLCTTPGYGPGLTHPSQDPARPRPRWTGWRPAPHGAPPGCSDRDRTDRDDREGFDRSVCDFCFTIREGALLVHGSLEAQETARSRLKREGGTRKARPDCTGHGIAGTNLRPVPVLLFCSLVGGIDPLLAYSRLRSDEGRKRKLEAPNSEGSPVASGTADLKALLDQHSDQMRRMQSQIDGLVAINSTLQARLDGHAESQAQEVNELRVKCNVLESRCGSLERSVQVLRKDVSWSYSAPSIPRSHWIGQGRDDEYADNMEWCLGRIKGDVKRIRNGEDEDFYCSCLDNEDTILHDDALLPHFKELADAIQLSDGIEKIDINYIELHSSALGILCPAMEGRVKSIDMRRIRFPGPDVVECYEIIATSIRRNHTLKDLAWINNRIPSNEQADLLIKSIIDNRSIKEVVLAYCFNQGGVNGCRALATLMTCGRPFQTLDFSDNVLSSIDDVAAALATNPQLTELWIHDNQLNDRDAELIAQALKQNTNLQRLYLSGNSITSAGFETIRLTIYDPSSLNAMESCNHTCRIDCVEGNAHDMTPRQRRNRKLYKLLSTRHMNGSNARHLNAEFGEEQFTIRLVPKVLHCIKCYSIDETEDSSTPLSITFELIKSWMMPEIFEHHSNHGGGMKRCTKSVLRFSASQSSLDFLQSYQCILQCYDQQINTSSVFAASGQGQGALEIIIKRGRLGDSPAMSAPEKPTSTPQYPARCSLYPVPLPAADVLSDFITFPDVMSRPHPVDGAPQRVAQTVPPSQRAEVYPEYLPPSLPVRHGDLHLHLEPSRTEQCRVEELPPVRHPHHEDVGECPDAVELREELVHDRVPRGPARVPAVGPAAEDGVDLVDDDDVQGAVQVREVLLAGARREAARLELVLGVAEEVPDELLRASDPPVQKLA
ncbi:hypothetical protein THAOC_26423 [Thalassiosira oceanica]|uniref:Uncharacterized protein n=1 Tax=Thalassiosira oceanica TaxID=159749 RepID=K0RJX7_THAOC|nr:hypothetical protein THAOC_26423 [Thalassiosira oceanica]|eukprot:EJK54028.1 hypothetical protein THAOC_26423 [Thalassiosira oceanica]